MDESVAPLAVDGLGLLVVAGLGLLMDEGVALLAADGLGVLVNVGLDLLMVDDGTRLDSETGKT
jgi:hypothetical protein